MRTTGDRGIRLSCLCCGLVTWNAGSPWSVACELITVPLWAWFGCMRPEDLILYKLRYYAISQQTKHIRDIGSILESVGEELDWDYLNERVVRLRLEPAWFELLGEVDRLRVPWPPGFIIRPPLPEEAQQVSALICACDIADTGEPDWTVEETRGDWMRLGFDLARDARVAVAAGGRLVAYTDVLVRPNAVQIAANTSLHPEFRTPGARAGSD